MLTPALLCALALAALVGFTKFACWPLPVALAGTAVLVGIVGAADVPMRHFVEGGFGYLNLILALFAGAWFGHSMHASGATDALASRILWLTGARPIPTLSAIGVLLYVTGMFVGIAGVAVLVIGVFAKPALERVGLESHQAAAFVAIEATCGMIAPPVNVPAMMIADGVNMPFLDFARTLLAISVPVASFTVWLFARRCAPRAALSFEPQVFQRAQLLFPLAATLAFWLALRLFPDRIYDPGVPIVLVVAALLITPFMRSRDRIAALQETFSGVPVFLAAALVAVGMLLQIMTLTGMRGWLVMQTLASESPWLHVLLVSLPLFGGVLTSAGAANLLGVPFAFAFIDQDMIINVSALSSIAAIAEFMPPTAIGAALSGYVIGAPSLWRICRAAWPSLVLLAAISLGLIVFAKPLARFLVGS